MNVIKKGKDLYFGIDWRSMCMCDVMCDVLSQQSTFQFFDAKTEMDKLSFLTVRSVHAVQDPMQ